MEYQTRKKQKCDFWTRNKSEEVVKVIVSVLRQTAQAVVLSVKVSTVVIDERIYHHH